MQLGKDRSAVLAFILILVQFTVLTASMAGNVYAEIEYKDITPNGFNQVVEFSVEFKELCYRFVYSGYSGCVNNYSDVQCNMPGCGAMQYAPLAVLVLAAIADFFYFILIFMVPYLFPLNNGRACVKWTCIVLTWLAWFLNFGSWIVNVTGVNYWAGVMASNPNFISYVTSQISSYGLSVSSATSGSVILPQLYFPTANSLSGGSIATFSPSYIGGDVKPYFSFWGILAANILGTVSTILLTRVHVHPFGIPGKSAPAVPLQQFDAPVF